MASRSTPRSVALLSAVVILLVTAGCLGTSVGAPTDAAALPTGSNDSVRTIDVSASGTATADPDLALVNVAVEARADSADAARSQVAADVASMRKALRDLGVPDDAVHTTSYTVGPEYNYQNGNRELVGYHAVHAFQIESAVDRAGKVIDAAVSGGATQIRGVQFTLKDETRKQLRKEALTEAVSNAHADAQTVATAADVTLGPLHSASTADVGYPRPVVMTAEAGGSGGASAPTTVEPGPVTVTASVSLSYEIR